MTTFPFDEIKQLVAEGERGVALLLIFRRLNEMLCDGRFAEVDAVLESVPLDDHDTSTALGYVTMTWPAKRKLQNFQPFVDRLRPWMTDKIGEERTTKLLRIADR